MLNTKTLPSIDQARSQKIVAAFRGMHVLPAKHSYAWLPRKCDYLTDRRTDRKTEAGQSDPYVPLCYAGDPDRRRTKWSLCAAILRRDTKTDSGQSDLYVPLCFAGDTKHTILSFTSWKFVQLSTCSSISSLYWLTTFSCSCILAIFAWCSLITASDDTAFNASATKFKIIGTLNYVNKPKATHTLHMHMFRIHTMLISQCIKVFSMFSERPTKKNSLRHEIYQFYNFSTSFMCIRCFL